MLPLLSPPLPPGCPWSAFTPPNVNWCEAERCGWIVNPSDAWSNLLYLVLGVWMWREARQSGRADLARFGPAGVAIGVFSFAYHASYTFALQFFDFVAMFLFSFTVLARNAVRLRWIAPAHETRFFVACVALFSALVPPLFRVGFPIQALVALGIAVALAQEWRLRRRDGASPAYRSYRLALLLLGAAALASLADVTRAWCDPTSWLQGHALWHVLSALALASLFRFYASLPSARAGVELASADRAA
ncbi:MAG TPA: ceramidase domain-containing protein [Myxococcota bacterium]|nr:ceramidase domain-containing protein [Myxococcota bacterium]